MSSAYNRPPRGDTISPPYHGAAGGRGRGRGSNGAATNGRSNGLGSSHHGAANGASGGDGRRGMVSGAQSLAYTYSPLEHSTASSNWRKIPKGLSDVVLGSQVSSANAAGGGGGGGGSGGGVSNQSKTYRLAVKRTVISVALSCCFGLGTMVFRGKQSGLEFFAGYLVEQSLSES